jgi:AraC-like DNA-binding protein
MDPRVKHAVAVISEHLRLRISIAAMAAEAGLSVSQFTRLFRRDLGSAPSAFVSRLRMERAALLLERTNLSVMEVMREVGISDPSHFARDFRRAHGFSPRTFRQHVRSSVRWPGRLVPSAATNAGKSEQERRSGRTDRRRITRTDRRGAPRS